ncbi:hypothetical protein ACLKA6_012843 [Drosophila palustris]
MKSTHNVCPFPTEVDDEKEGIVGLSRTAWNVIIHADLEDYGAFKHRVEESWASLLTIKSRLKNDSHIDNMMSLLTNKATRLQQHDDIIQQTQARKTQRVPRAPLKAFGAIYHAVFGLMDEDHADEPLQKVQQSRQNEEYLLDLLRNQSSVQDATVQMMKKQNEVIWGNFNIINTAMYSMKNALNTAIDHEVFLDAYETLSMAMDAFEQLQRDIINIIWNTNGNFLDSLLPTTQFQKQIQRIVLNMPEGVQLPTLDPLELGRISKITTRTTSSAILFNQQPGPCTYPCCNKDPHNDPCSNKGSEDQRPYEDERPRQSSDYVTSEDPLRNSEGRQPGPQDERRNHQHYYYDSYI